MLIKEYFSRHCNDIPKPKRHIKTKARKRCGVLSGSQQPGSLGNANSVSRVLRLRTTGLASSSPLLLDTSTIGWRSSRDIFALTGSRSSSQLSSSLIEMRKMKWASVFGWEGACVAVGSYVCGGVWIRFAWVVAGLAKLRWFVFPFAPFCSLQGPPSIVVAYHWSTLLSSVVVVVVACCLLLLSLLLLLYWLFHCKCRRTIVQLSGLVGWLIGWSNFIELLICYKKCRKNYITGKFLSRKRSRCPSVFAYLSPRNRILSCLLK